MKLPGFPATIVAVTLSFFAALYLVGRTDRSPIAEQDRARTLTTAEEAPAGQPSPALSAHGDSGILGRNSFAREGVNIELAVGSATADSNRVVADDIARIEFQITNEANDQPVSGLYPAAWIDPIDTDAEVTIEQCREKAGLYLRGLIGVRPMIDLNSYYIVVLNEDPSIAVIDPIIGIRGITKLLTQIALPGRANDWTRSADEKRAFLAIPARDMVASVSLETFRLEKTVSVGELPTRVYVQPDGRLLWVGHGGRRPGVTVLDAGTLDVVAEIPTGAGHHEIVADADSRNLYITNRDDKTVSIISIAELEVSKTVRLDGTPVDVAVSELSGAAYISNGDTGEIIVLDDSYLEERDRVKSAPGAGPIGVSRDGRWAFVVNTAEDMVVVIDTATNRVVHEIEIEGQPFHLTFSRNFAFIRALQTPDVSMVQLDTLGAGGQPIVLSFAAGTRAPDETKTLLPSNLFATAVTEAALLAVSPSDATVFYYMEGMNAPMGSFRNYGHRPMSVMIADRTIRETSDGVYSASLKIPAAGDYQLIMTMDSPEMIECFRFRAEPNPNAVVDLAAASIAYETQPGTVVNVGEAAPVRFSLHRNDADQSPFDSETVQVLTYRAPNADRKVLPARNLGGGAYEALLEPENAGVYYVYPAAPDLQLGVEDLEFITLIARASEEDS